MIFRFKKFTAHLRFVAAIAVCVAAPLCAVAEKTSTALAANAFYNQALLAMDEGIPQVGIQKLNECLAGKLAPQDRAEVLLQLARAEFSADRASDALKTIQRLPLPLGESANFLKARALTATGRWSEACGIYQSLAAQPGAPLVYRLGEAECLRETNRTAEAIRLLEPLAANENAPAILKLRLADYYLAQKQAEKCDALLQTVAAFSPLEKKWRAYIAGRLMLAQGKNSDALLAFDEVFATPEGLTENLLVGAVLGRAEATLATKGPEVADNVIEDFIRQHPDVAGIDILFRRLDEIYRMEKDPSDSELQKWSENNPAHRAGLATFYLAKNYWREQKTDAALRAIDAFIATYPQHALLAEAHLLRGRILIDQQKIAPALQSFQTAILLADDSEVIAEAEMSAATAHFKQREFAQAQVLFRSAAQHSERFWQRAIFNSALSWLNQANYDKFLGDYKELSGRFPDSELRSELVLEEGLLQARSGDPRAAGTLQIFIRDFPKHPRLADASLALAEIAYLAPSQNLALANDYLKVAYTAPKGGDTQERANYLAIFMAESDKNRDENSVVKLCQQFIRTHPASPLLADVRMKLGQVWFHREDYPDAQTQFETLAHEIPGSPFAEAALYLAAQSALKTMNTERALELFEEVKKFNGPLKNYALQQQAILKSRLGSNKEAIILYDNILAAKPDGELKFAALCGRGDNYFLLGGADAKNFDQALAAFNELATQPDVPASWRNQALYMKGKCLEKENKPSEALAAYYDVLQPPANRAEAPEYLWFYKAGFDAAHILESQEQWKPALAVYKKLAATTGPRAEEAKARVTQLRLEHFIWEE
jgi:tetratricopeptide (TPR) repeat protein